jgi:hypothetical protein
MLRKYLHYVAKITTHTTEERNNANHAQTPEEYDTEINDYYDKSV